MFMEINIIKGNTLCSYNWTVMEEIRIVFYLSINSFLGNMVQLSLYNTTNVMNGDTLQIISLRFLLIMSVAEASDVVEVYALAEDVALDCYIPACVLIRIPME